MRRPARSTHALDLALVGMALAAPCALAAPPLADPTRPPLLQASPAAAGDGAAYGLRHPLKLAAGRQADPASAPAAVLPQVQSVFLPRQGQPTALVDGRLLRLGDRLAGPLGERVVSAIDERGLLLAPVGRDRAPQRLWLLGATAPEAANAAPNPVTSPAGTARPAPDKTPTPPATVAGRSPP